MSTHLTMPLWQQLLLILGVPVVIAVLGIGWKLSMLSRQGSTRPLRKRKRRRH